MALQLDKPMVDTSGGDDDGWGGAFRGGGQVLPAVTEGLLASAAEIAANNDMSTQRPELPVK